MCPKVYLNLYFLLLKMSKMTELLESFFAKYTIEAESCIGELKSQFRDTDNLLKTLSNNIDELKELKELEEKLEELEEGEPPINASMPLNAEQYARIDTFETILNPNSPESLKKWHALLLKIGYDDAILVKSCYLPPIDGKKLCYTKLDDVGETHQDVNGIKVTLYGVLDYARLSKKCIDYTDNVTGTKHRTTLSDSPRYNTMVVYMKEGASIDSKIYEAHAVPYTNTLVFHGVKKIFNLGDGIVYFGGEGLGFTTGLNIGEIETAFLITYKM